MIPGDIQSDGKPIIRSGTQRSGSAATGGLHLSEIPQKPRFEKFSGGVGHGWETQVQVGDNIRIGYRSMGTNYNGKSDSGFSFSLLYLFSR